MFLRFQTRVFIVLFFCIFQSQGAWAQSIEAIKENSKGVEVFLSVFEKLKEHQEEAQKNARPGAEPPKVELNPDDFTPALNHFLRGLGLDPRSSSLRFNLALTLQVQGKLESALKEYDSLLQTSGDEFKFNILFNKAIIYTQLKEIEKALENYQQALELNPESKEVKTNIELLWQQSQGEGSGDGQQDKPQEDQDKGKEGENPKPSDKEQKKKPQKPKDLSEKEIKKILNELKDQEQKIRAKELKQKLKETPREKDW